MVAKQLITVVAGFVVGCCPAWAGASVCHTTGCGKTHCSCLSRKREGSSSCGMKVWQWKLWEADHGAVSDCCEGEFSCCPMEHFARSTKLRSDLAGTPILSFYRSDPYRYKQRIADAPETWVLGHSQRQACLGVWLK